MSSFAGRGRPAPQLPTPWLLSMKIVSDRTLDQSQPGSQMEPRFVAGGLYQLPSLGPRYSQNPVPPLTVWDQAAVVVLATPACSARRAGRKTTQHRFGCWSSSGVRSALGMAAIKPSIMAIFIRHTSPGFC